MRYAAIFFFSLLFTVRATAQDSSSIDLRGLAAFRTGDDDVWRSKYIDEQEGWNFIPVPGPWERHGFPLTNGFAWYRVRFRIPAALEGDSLLLVMSGVDDADETFLNGVLVGKSGTFPPHARSELRSLRVYPLPRFIREEHNLLAVRVFDQGDLGGITGNIFRIIRADSMHRVLDEIVDAPSLPAPHFLSNGMLVSAMDLDSGRVSWVKPHPYAQLSPDLSTEVVLSQLFLSVEENCATKTWRPDTSGYLGSTSICHGRDDSGIEAFWYHPLLARERILVVAVRQSVADERELGLQFVMEQPYWRYEERKHEEAGTRMTYHILTFNSCCTELVDRDMEAFLDRGSAAYLLDDELRAWQQRLTTMRYPPDLLSVSERRVYQRAISTLLSAQVREEGLAGGQILSALHPQSKAVTIPADHLLAAEALALAGLTQSAEEALAFINDAESGRYVLFDVLGDEHGVGFPYLVTPSRYFGMGSEWIWPRADEAVFRYDGMPRYIFAVEALRSEMERRSFNEGIAFSDSSFLASKWERISARVADVLMYRLDSLGFLPQDASPWGSALSDVPGPYATLLAVRALRISASWADIMGDELKHFLYNQAASKAEKGLKRLAASIRGLARAEALTSTQQAFFHPFVIDGVSGGIFLPNSDDAQLAFDIVERGFAIEDTPLQYSGEPDGDWFARQARPQIALRLARAYAAAGNVERAEQLFAAVTRIAAARDGLLPELIEPVSGNCYGGLPHTPTAADYILTAERIVMMRLARQ
jgi:hypothetical protein